MTKTEAREYALKVLAAEVRHHVANGSEWMEMPHGVVAGAKLDNEGKFSEADTPDTVGSQETVSVTQLPPRPADNPSYLGRKQCDALNAAVE